MSKIIIGTAVLGIAFVGTVGGLYLLNNKTIEKYKEAAAIPSEANSMVNQVQNTETVTTDSSKTVIPPQQENTKATPEVKDDRCIITVNDKKYDVTIFRKIHEGGDVFDCGMDNTEKFYSEHGDSKLEKMVKYLIG